MLDSTPRTFIGATTFQVTGMTCGHCQRAVTEEISRIPGIQGVGVDLATGSRAVSSAAATSRNRCAASGSLRYRSPNARSTPPVSGNCSGSGARPDNWSPDSTSDSSPSASGLPPVAATS